MWDSKGQLGSSDWNGGNRLRLASPREKALYRGASKVFFTVLDKFFSKEVVRERVVGGFMVGVEAKAET